MPTPGQNDRHFLLDPATTAAAPAISAGRRGTCITIQVNEPGIATVVECDFDRLVLERSTDSRLSWQEVTAPATRPQLEATVQDYTIIDGLGSSAYFYRTRYLNSQTGEKTEPSEDISGAGLAIRNLLTVDQLTSRYFFGIDLTDESGAPLSDSVFQHYILAAIQTLEHELDISLLPTTFCELHDYYRNDYHAFNFINLDNYPVQEVIEFRVQYPSGQTVIVFPNEWIRLNAEAGQLQIVPTAGTLSEILVGQGGSFLPAIYNGLDYLPHLFQVQLIAGFGEGQVPQNIIDAIGKLASLGPFNIFGDLIAGAGIGTLSLSLDGLSQSIGTTASATNAGYGARIIQYTKELKETLPMLKRYYKRATGMVVA